MLSLTHFIARELKEQDKLPEKYESLVNFEMNLVTSDGYTLHDKNGLILTVAS